MTGQGVPRENVRNDPVPSVVSSGATSTLLMSNVSAERACRCTLRKDALSALMCM